MNMTTVPSNQLKAMQQEIESLKEQNASLSLLASRYSKGMKDNLAECLKGQETIAQQAEAIRLKDAALEHVVGMNLSMVTTKLCKAALATQPSPDILQARDERVAEAIAEAIGGCAYDCTRVWEAWGYGTMSEADFVPVVDQSDRIAEIASAAIAAMIPS